MISSDGAEGSSPAAPPAVAVRIGGLPATAGPVRHIEWDAMPAAVRGALGPRVERLGYLGAFFSFGAHQPGALLAFHSFTEELKRALPADLTELVALTVATASGNEYERVQHERLSDTLGFSADWVAAAATGKPADVLTPAQRAARDLALHVLSEKGNGSGSHLATLTDLVGEEAAVGVLLLIGRYIAHAHVSNALALTNPVRQSPPDGGPDGPSDRAHPLDRRGDTAAEAGGRGRPPGAG